MELLHLHKARIEGRWTHDHRKPITCLVEHQRDRAKLTEVYQPQVCLNLTQFNPLYEATYKEIAQLIDGNFLNQKVRADELRGIFYRGFQNDIMQFEINRSEFRDNHIRYRNMVRFSNWDEVGQDRDFNSAEKARMLLWVGDIRLHCTCPSFLFWGYQYMLTVLDSSIWPEQRKPVIRNPGERGIVCKHLNRLLRVLPFYNGEIAQEQKKQFGGE